MICDRPRHYSLRQAKYGVKIVSDAELVKCEVVERLRHPSLPGTVPGTSGT